MITPEDATGPSPQDLATVVSRAWEAWLEGTRRTPSPHAQVWASSWRACERRMTYDLTAPDQQLPFDTAVLARFLRGNDRERDLLLQLVRIGQLANPPFTVERQQERFEVKGRSGVPVLSGKVDGRLRFEGVRYSPPLEVKAWSANLVERIETFEDVFASPWTQAGGYQLLSYLYGNNVPYGFLLLDRGGLPRLVLVELTDVNWERMEGFLAKAERVVAHAAAGTLPDYIDDAAECKRCPYFGTACQPPITSRTQDVLLDPDLEADLERWWALREPGREWQGLDARIKDKLRGVESAVAGHFAINGRWGKQSRVDLPPDLRKQYTVVDPKGRFTLEVERL